MKLTYFSNQTMPKGVWGGGKSPRISFSKGGIITINSAAISLMDLKVSDKISLAQDEEDPSNWYVFKDKENGYEMRSKDFEKTGLLCFNHGELRRSFIESLGRDTEASHKFTIAGQPTLFGKQEYWGILINA